MLKAAIKWLIYHIEIQYNRNSVKCEHFENLISTFRLRYSHHQEVNDDIITYVQVYIEVTRYLSRNVEIKFSKCSHFTEFLLYCISSKYSVVLVISYSVGEVTFWHFSLSLAHVFHVWMSLAVVYETTLIYINTLCHYSELWKLKFSLTSCTCFLSTIMTLLCLEINPHETDTGALAALIHSFFFTFPPGTENKSKYPKYNYKHNML